MQYLKILCLPESMNLPRGTGPAWDAINKQCPVPSTGNEPKTIDTNATICDRWCGAWATKEAALSSLFSRYRRKTGKIVRWYINWQGYLEWFEVGEKPRIRKITANDNTVLSFTTKEDSTGIINNISGTYGEGDNEGTVQLDDDASIATYGLCIQEGLSEKCMDETEMLAYVQKLLDEKKNPIYSATIEFSGFYLIEPGKMISFPDDPYYNEIKWTVVDWEFGDSGGKAVTKINVTTDASVISLPNEFEIIEGTAKKEVQDSRAIVGEVTAVPTGGESDRCNVLISKGLGSGGKTNVSVRNVGGRFARLGS